MHRCDSYITPTTLFIHRDKAPPPLGEGRRILWSLFTFDLAVTCLTIQFLSRRWVALSPYIFLSLVTGCPQESTNVSVGGGSSLWDGFFFFFFLWLLPHSHIYRMPCVSRREFRAWNELWEHLAAPSRTSCRIISCSTFFCGQFQLSVTQRTSNTSPGKCNSMISENRVSQCFLRSLVHIFLY